MARYDSTLFLLVPMISVGNIITSPTFADTAFVFAVRPIPMVFHENAVAITPLISVWSPFVLFVAVPATARVVDVIAGTPADREFAPL